ncbi:26s proteasome non-atpase regulatory subunit 3 [Anaeramoeba flamelloides]|uniref:26s proteasome non-atpase regulatory subunit 3 n=1 Tax=Anaeramoeba flamelloides TaxID=1746091 RepID=A0ABQ8X5Y5_9EUKA|nr:26s proteasome non-atpase regulatory subunit 3 [Anaeramoeba flamelloides]
MEQTILSSKDLITIQDLKEHLLLLQKSVNEDESRYLVRVLRKLSITRRRITPQILAKLIEESLKEESKTKSLLIKIFPSTLIKEEKKEEEEKEMQIEIEKEKEEEEGEDEEKSQKQRNIIIQAKYPEEKAYLQLLSLLELFKLKDYENALKLCEFSIDFIEKKNRRTLDSFLSKVFFYYSRINEILGHSKQIRKKLLSAYRTSTLRRDVSTQAVLINCLLRNYLQFNLYDQGDKLISKSQFPPNSLNSQHVRYLYYLGRIKAIQLDYTESFRCLREAKRKAPRAGARGFRLSVNKFLCIVQLLTGEIPEIELFMEKDLQKYLQPYFELTSAVRTGNLGDFKKVVLREAQVFKADQTYSLILRLRQNVIKTGLKKLNSAYSKISFEDISKKLQLDSSDSVESICSKAIFDGVIDAIINHEEKYIKFKEMGDLYSTLIPQKAFGQRIKFCLNIHNIAVKNMRFPEELLKEQEEIDTEEGKEQLKELEKMSTNNEEGKGDFDQGEPGNL